MGQLELRSTSAPATLNRKTGSYSWPIPQQAKFREM
jgi:hypothetical protein